MAKHIDTGKLGEKLARSYLQANGFRIVHENWRNSHYEIDIIATKSGVLHFIEVKTRRSEKYGLPEDNVGKKKLENLINAGEEFLDQYPDWELVQYDILSIILDDSGPPEYFLIEDVYL